jgi:hypothetical protein
MTITKEVILANLNPGIPTRHSLLERGQQYLDRDVPE